MRASFLIFYVLFSSTILHAEFAVKTEIKRDFVKKIDYKRAINASNKYALKGDIKNSLKYATIAYNISKTKESMYLLARIYNKCKRFEDLRLISSEILKKDKNDYLGLKYMTFSLINLKSKKALEFAKRGYKHYGKDFSKLLDKAYDLV
ncbi:hypothetical protein [Caminibacter pacificus]|uniref:Tetratricopeptide repeat-containing protein n=1 Tax=Caminibacter pacificus TaxID=1424653 RepID=A0AAJ4UY60_9BACT|nr:hypothetical protein [Caminibacter pacificus]QCI27683.1 hypothetical protein C6V80_01490 [Caminibacter pacificus]ROR40142.1 hypothetical protein EDC58_1129 [Caminibacter pacificus]